MDKVNWDYAGKVEQQWLRKTESAQKHVVIDLCTEVTYIPNKTSGTEKEKCAENVVQQLVCIESNGGINGVYGQTTREQFAIIKLQYSQI